MNITLKEMKLTFKDNGSTWDKIITDLNGNVIYQQLGLVLMTEHRRKEYFNEWEAQLKNIPHWNIVEVERFI